MAVTKQEIAKLAWLAKLKLSDAELDELTNDMTEIIAFADTINQSVGATSSGTVPSMRSVSMDELREDVVVESYPNEAVTSNIEAENGFFPVRRRSL